MAIFSQYIHMINRCTGIYCAEHLRESGLGQNHPWCLISVCRHPGISQEKLARRLYINKSNVTRRLSYLESAGFVERRQSEEDKRVMLVYPTEKAYEILPSLRVLFCEWEDAITSELSPEEVEAFKEMLKRVAKNASTLIDSQALECE